MTEHNRELDEVLPDRYTLERELGRGGMAVVYLARDRKHDRKVALKVLRSEVAGSMGADRFLREIRIAANLSHPHILALYDSGETEGVFYYVMPYVEGETLRDRLDREGELSVEKALGIIREVAGALAHAHEQGLVHRDIKPANIFLSQGHALLADFGIARAVGEAGSERLTRTGLAIGTPRYMSPEQWSGDSSVDARTDIYSLACVLYETLTGEPPFTGDTPQVILARQAKDPIPSVQEERPDVPAGVDAAITRALSKEPADRFSDVEEFVESFTDAGTAPSIPGRNRWLTLLRRLRNRVALRYVALLLFAGSGLGYAALSNLADTGGNGDRERIVVLPFRHIGPAEAEYFSAGITEEITGRLSAVSGLGVIAPTSARKYEDSDKSPQQIASELDVRYLMEGSVRWGGGNRDERRVRVTSRVVRGSDGEQIWTESYDGQGSEVLAIQTRISREVTSALDVVLGEQERDELEDQPTENLAAFDYYLRGNDFYRRSWERENVARAIDMYRRATERDPTFTEALARLGQTHAWMFRLGYDRSEERLEASRSAIDSALALDQRSTEARVASGLYYYWGRWDYDEAIAELATAREIEPGNALVHRQIGNVRRRQGEWDATIESYERAGELDPRNHLVWFNMGETYLHIRQYEEAERYLTRATTLAPDFFGGQLLKIFLRINRSGETEGARKVLTDLEEQFSPSDWRPLLGFWTFGLSRMLYSPEEALRRMEPGRYGMDSVSYHLAKAGALERLDEESTAEAHYDSARVLLERKRVPRDEQTPDDAWTEGRLGVAYAASGRDEQAVRHARRAVSLTSEDAFDGPQWIYNLAQVHFMAGDTTEALDQLELVVSIPSRQSRHWLREDPKWDPIRSRSRFQALVQSEQDSVQVAASQSR